MTPQTQTNTFEIYDNTDILYMKSIKSNQIKSNQNEDSSEIKYIGQIKSIKCSNIFALH